MRNWSGSGTGCQACSTTSKAMWAATTREQSSDSDKTLPSVTIFEYYSINSRGKKSVGDQTENILFSLVLLTPNSER